MLNFIKQVDYFKKWGTERAVIDTLGGDDKKWVTLRYDLSLNYINQDDLVLDAACGSGFGTEVLATKARKVYGVDICRDAIKYASCRHNHKNVEFSVENVEKLSYKDNCFDVSVGIETLEHLKNYEGYLKQIKRVTKNNGRVIISTPQKRSDIPLTPFHIKEFGYFDFIVLLQKYFVVEKIIGLKRLYNPIYTEVSEDNFGEFDIYLSICRNLKYIEENYRDDYYESVNNGFIINPVGKMFTESISASIIGNKVLSLGCGTGILEKTLLEKNPKLDITGTDIVSTPYLHELRKKNGIKKFIVVKASKSFKQPFKNNSYDTVYTSHVLEHVQEPIKLIKESIRLSKYVAMHLIPINLYNPEHIHFFKFGNIDNEYRVQQADIDIKDLADNIVKCISKKYPKMFYDVEIVCARDGSIPVDNLDFQIKRKDRPDGLMPCFLVRFYKNGKTVFLKT